MMTWSASSGRPPDNVPVPALLSRRTNSGLSSLSKGPSTDVLHLDALADEVGEIKFVSWISPEDFAFYSSPEGEAFLQESLDNAVMDSKLIDSAKAHFADSQMVE